MTALSVDPATRSSSRQMLPQQSVALLLHELRSPLASIQNAVTVLRRRSEDPALQRRMHDLIERQVRQIALLTGSFSPRPETAPPARERIDLCTVLRQAAETVAPELAHRRHELLHDLPESGVWVLGNASQLEQVFVNLLANASKYSHVGDRILLAMQVCDRQAVVQVRDQGIGIPAEWLPQIFELFVRADTEAVRTRSGLGIGLAVVRSILSSHQGSVSAASAGVGQGSEFTVRLALAA
jgi:two-component system, sensor histidine kinase